MADINLLKSEKKRGAGLEIQFSGSGKPLIWALAAVLVLILITFGIFYYLRSQVETELSGVKAAVAGAEQKMQLPPPELENAVKAQSALNALSGLLDKHLHWTNLWDELGKSTLKTARYLSISATTEKSDFVIEGRVENYEQLGKLMLGLQESKSFTDVQLVSSGPGKGEATGVEFSIDVKYDPELLLDKPDSSPN